MVHPCFLFWSSCVHISSHLWEVYRRCVQYLNARGIWNYATTASFHAFSN